MSSNHLYRFSKYFATIFVTIVFLTGLIASSTVETVDFDID